MKSFILSIIIFSALLAGISVNSIYVSNFSDKLTELAEAFPEDRVPDSDRTIEKLKDFWRKNEPFIMLTNDHTKIHEVYHHIQSLEAALISGNYPLYTEASLAILESAKAFKEFDTFSLVGVL